MPGTLDRLAVFVALLAVATAGLCLLEGHQVGTDLCVVLAVTLALPLALPLPVNGRSCPAPVRSRPVYAPDFPAPPPKA